MGLDMYLRRRVYLGGHFEHNRITGLDELNFHAGYWRKANQIHKWFVDNVQGGKDDCGDHYVPAEKLKELRELCVRAIETKDPSLLPPQTGFFFGSTEIDDGYWDDLKNTIEIIDKLDLTGEGYDEYYYRSSW